jgi:hypothetical protein
LFYPTNGTSVLIISICWPSLCVVTYVRREEKILFVQFHLFSFRLSNFVQAYVQTTSEDIEHGFFIEIIEENPIKTKSHQMTTKENLRTQLDSITCPCLCVCSFFFMIKLNKQTHHTTVKRADHVLGTGSDIKEFVLEHMYRLLFDNQ